MRWLRASAALMVILATLGMLGAVDLLAEPPEPAPPATTVGAGEPSISGRSVCAVGDGREGSSTTVEVVNPAEADGARSLADIERFGDGALTPRSTGPVTPGSPVAVDLAGDDALQAAQVSWLETPVSVARTWRLDDVADLPVGTVAGPCPTSTAASRWMIPGMSTAGGREGLVRLANPHSSGATLSVSFLTPEGPESPTRLRNVSLGAQEVFELSMNEFAPERPDLTVVVEVVSGRIAVEGMQLTRAAIGDVDGASLLQAATEPAESWTVPWVTDSGDRDSWLWVANDDDRTARVELSVHTPDGGVPAEGLSEVQVPPGTVRRVDLRGTLPEEVTTAAITARSDGVPVTVSGAVEVRSDEVEATGFVVQLGATAADPLWSLSGGATEDRSLQARLVNPTSEPAVVDVEVSDGTTTEVPAELAGLEVPPGAIELIDLGEFLDDVPAWSATVRATEGELVVGQVGNGDPSGRAHWVAVPGAASAAWLTGALPDARAVRGTTQRLGTELGIRPFDPLSTTPDEREAPEAPAPEVLEPPPVDTDGAEDDGDPPSDVEEPPEDAGDPGDDAVDDGDDGDDGDTTDEDAVDG